MSRRALLLAGPALGTLAVLMLLPMLIAAAYSVMTPSPYGGVEWPATGASYLRLVVERDLDDALGFDDAYLVVLARSALLALVATAICLAVALPTAWYMATRAPRHRRALVLLVTVPFWTNLLVRTYCWVLLLRDTGLVNQALMGAGLTDAPVTFLYGDGAVLLGLVYASLPFMVLPIYGTLERLDPALVEAAHDLYAGRAAVLRHVVWPLARPGVAAGALLVFVPSLGAFLSPEILGGGQKLMIGDLIEQQFTTARDWSFGSALSMVLMACVLGALVLHARRGGRVTA